MYMYIITVFINIIPTIIIIIFTVNTIMISRLKQATDILGLFPSQLSSSYFCLGHFYMLEESCKSHLKSIYTSLYH